MAAWEKLVQDIEKRSFKLAGIYATARLLSWGEGGIELGASGLLAADAENISELKKLIQDVLGSPVDVKVKAVAAQPADKARSVAEMEAQRAEAMREKREQEARAHPVTEKVIQTFGAAIKEIKVDG